MDALEEGLPDPEIGPGDAPAAEEVWDEDGRWWTSFPPPADFNGEEVGVWNGLDWYARTLTARESARMELFQAEQIAEERVAECSRRDRLFGFAGDQVSFPMEAEPYETSGPSDPDSAPIEYKSAFPPRFARRRGDAEGLGPQAGARFSSRDSVKRSGSAFAAKAPETRAPPRLRVLAEGQVYPERLHGSRRAQTRSAPPNLSPTPRIP